jgi:hypothetical protein
MVERLHGTIRQRKKVMRGLDDEATAQTMMGGLQITKFLETTHGFRRKEPSTKSETSQRNRQNKLGITN